MRLLNDRPLAEGERRALSPGLAEALRAVGAEPMIVDRVHPAARISALWRGAVPILTRGDRIFWPGAPTDLSATRAMPVLQHELQHVLDYRTGRLTTVRYVIDPREWGYGVNVSENTDFDVLGAEQRAVLAERLWLAENGSRADADLLRRVIPWA